ncbi:MAG TPA: hypothetical protein VD913_01065 [bacterium]|nr:hypothetical protein [bacterium]
MIDSMRVKKTGIRLLALLLCLFSLQRAWAGVWIYQGERAFKDKNFVAAFNELQKAEPWDQNNPRLNLLFGESAWHLGVREKDAQWFKKSRSYLQPLTQQLPYFGRGWLYLALSRLGYEDQSVDGVTFAEWNEIKPFLENALQGEPTSPLILYLIGLKYLTYSEYLEAHEKELAMKRIKKSLSLHYPGQVSPYLDPALQFLWARFHDFEILKQITPTDLPSSTALLLFTEKRGLWENRDEVYAVFLHLTGEAYNQLTTRGEQLLLEGKNEKAWFEFQKAFWIQVHPVRARAGMLIARYRMNRLPEDYETVLKDILEEEEQGSLGNLWRPLGAVVDASGNAYLRGLYGVRENDWEQACKSFSQAAYDKASLFLRQYQTVCLLKSGEKEQAFKVIQSILAEEGPDLRELYLLKERDTPFREEIDRKIEATATVYQSNLHWWRKGWVSSNRLDRRDQIGMLVNLKPGKVRFLLWARTLPGDGEYGYLLVRLWDGIRDRLLGTAYLNHYDWKKIAITTETTGGKRWFDIELFNGAPSDEQQTGPAIELGPLEVEYLS